MIFTRDFLKEFAKGRDFWGLLNGKLCLVKVLGNNQFQLWGYKLEDGELDIARKTPPPIDMKFYHTKGECGCYILSEKNSV